MFLVGGKSIDMLLGREVLCWGEHPGLTCGEREYSLTLKQRDRIDMVIVGRESVGCLTCRGRE